jgi:low temperature requirement protein LtrA
VRVFGTSSLAGLLAVMAGALLDGGALYAFWSLAIVLDLGAAGVGGQLEGWNLHPDHFVERHGLIVIIALGEALIVAAAGLAGAAMTPALLATGALAVAVTCGLWWSYFRHARQAFEHALAAREGSARSALARNVFSVMHFPMLCGVIGMAAATEQALAHPDLPLDLGLRIALGIGAALFVCGTAAALHLATGRAQPWRWLVASSAAAGLIVLGATPWVAMTLLLGMLAAVAITDHRRFVPAPSH